MKLKFVWKNEEDGVILCKRIRKEICRIRLYVVGEQEAELSLELPDEIKEESAGLLSDMKKVLKKLTRLLQKEGFMECSFVEEKGKVQETIFWILNSTRVVSKSHSEYFLKKVSEQNAEEPQKLLILQEKNEFFCTWAEEESLFSCKLRPYLDGYYVYEVLVREDMRGKGIGTAAMQELTARMGTCYLQVSSRNERALRLYRRLGFETETELCYYQLGQSRENRKRRGTWKRKGSH